LSRACLAKWIIFSIKWRKKGAFSYLGALLERQHTVFVLEEDEALLEKRVSFSGSFAAVCPEPVLANVRFSL
jgi:hypothetical protein